MTEISTVPTAPTPTALGQATAIEQARAEAEVKAAVVVAQQCPRNVAIARQSMIESCEQRELAERAFFRYSRAGSRITGPTVHLARELARCWGNIQYGISELRRDDIAGESEMMAFAWDVQTNTRSASIFIVPHVRDKTGGGTRLTETRDIYENNANMGARRVREAIFAILPPWFTEQAKAVCNATIEAGDGTPLPDRISRAVDAFGKANVTKKQLEEKIGLRADRWTAKDVAALEVIFRALVSRETTKEEEFGAGGLSAALAAQTSGAEAAPEVPSPSAEPTAPSAPDVSLCPECAQGKHQNCSGQAWDAAADAPGPCQCSDESHAVKS